MFWLLLRLADFLDSVNFKNGEKRKRTAAESGNRSSCTEEGRLSFCSFLVVLVPAESAGFYQDWQILCTL